MDVAGTFCENVVKSFKPGKIYRPCSARACIGKNGDLLVTFFIFLVLEGEESIVVLYFDLAILSSLGEGGKSIWILAFETVAICYSANLNLFKMVVA